LEVSDKESVRKRALQRRRQYVSSLSEETQEHIAIHLVERVQSYFLFPKHFVIGTYYPRDDEQNVRLLNFFLQDEGHVIAYPRVEEDNSLSFRKVNSSKELVMGSFNVKEAPESAPIVQPDLYFVPLLAFDSRCHRLGYGKGHFDRALENARAQRNVLAIGVAYDMQRVDRLANESFDEQLDFVVTESQVYKAEV
jgi:5-formyltetrahydrofolate cyclo-ligase